MKKITFLINSFSSGGAERFVSILLKKLIKRYEVHLVLINDNIFYEIPKDVKVHFLEKSNPNENGIKKLLKIPFLAFKYAKFLREHNIDVSVSLLNRSNYINSIAKKSCKTIISERIAPSNEYKSNSLRDKISRFLIKKLYNRADLIIPNAIGIKEDLIKNFNIDGTKIKIIYNPIDLKKIENLRKEIINIPKNKFTFITIGRFHPQKNHKLLLEAMKNIDANLWIIGDGKLRGDLEFRIKELGVENKVTLLGRQKNPFKFLNMADCFVFSSNYEGFPNALLEALACELPIISTDCLSGPREILAPNTEYNNLEDIELAEYGILTPVNDVDSFKKAMKLIIENDNLKKKYKQKALKRAKDFEVNKIIKEWIRVIDN